MVSALMRSWLALSISGSCLIHPIPPSASAMKPSIETQLNTTSFFMAVLPISTRQFYAFDYHRNCKKPSFLDVGKNRLFGAEIIDLLRKIFGRNAGELLDVVNEMRLVIVVQSVGNVGKPGETPAGHQPDRRIKAFHPNVKVWRNADRLAEAPLKLALGDVQLH